MLHASVLVSASARLPMMLPVPLLLLLHLLVMLLTADAACRGDVAAIAAAAGQLLIDTVARTPTYQ